MSTEPGSDGGRTVPTMECRVCEMDVPAGAFCGFCGAHMTRHRGDGPDWLRAGAFGAAPAEHVLRPSVVSSLFPQLPSRSRTPFRIALLTLFIVVFVFAALSWQAPLVAVAMLGFPLLFVLYLQESDGFKDLPISTLLLTAVLGVGMGAAWAMFTDRMFARSYDVAIGTSVNEGQMLSHGLAVPLSGAILILLPALVVRLLRPPSRESLDGFLIGALGAIGFTAAASMARLAPQFATGVTARGRPVGSLVVEAGIHGLAVPLTAAAAGGLFGAALWFSRPAGHQHRLPGFVWPLLAFVVVLMVFTGLGAVDVADISQYVQLGLHVVVTVLAIVALRVVLQLALLHEAHDPSPGEPVLCELCDHVIPDMAFCPHCGVATRVASRSSRAERQESPPVPTDTTPDQ
jgi:RsiW-degrading membrane proteinase PrsW (M82 family)